MSNVSDRDERPESRDEDALVPAADPVLGGDDRDDDALEEAHDEDAEAEARDVPR